MSYPDCYEPAEHRRALEMVLADLKAAAETETGADQPCVQESASASIPASIPGPIVQVIKACQHPTDLIREQVN